MTERRYDTTSLIRLQQISWYVALAYFGILAVLAVIGIDNAVDLARYGVIYVLVITLTKLFIMAHQFRAVNLRKFSFLSYLLVLILVSIVLLRYLK